MYNIRYTFIIISFILFLSLQTLVEANATPEETIIKTYKEDVTGDSHKETILLYGTPLSNNSDYYKDIWATITFPDETKTTIPYKGGYQPKLEFADMNQNKANDIIFSTTIHQQNETLNYQLHTIKQNKPSEITLPTQKHIEGFYQDQFVVELQISPTDDPEVIDIKNRANEYIDSGIYNEKGKLMQTTAVQPQQFIDYEPIFLSSSKGYGLKSFQQINGINKSDKLGEIETLWYYEEDKWIILHSKWNPSSK